MMKPGLLFCAFCSISILLTLQAIGSASMIGMEVDNDFLVDFKVGWVNEEGNLVSASLGAHNTGSITYDARARMDILSGNRTLFTSWSGSEHIPPGSRAGFRLYGYKPDAADLRLRFRLYYGNEVKELEMVSIGNRSIPPSGPFSISNIKTYDSYIRLDVHSNQTVEGVVVMPEGFPPSWKVAHERLDSVQRGSTKQVVLVYETPYYEDTGIWVNIASEDGTQFLRKRVRLEKQSGLMKYINMFLDAIGGIFRT